MTSWERLLGGGGMGSVTTEHALQYNLPPHHATMPVDEPVYGHASLAAMRFISPGILHLVLAADCLPRIPFYCLHAAANPLPSTIYQLHYTMMSHHLWVSNCTHLAFPWPLPLSMPSLPSSLPALFLASHLPLLYMSANRIICTPPTYNPPFADQLC